MPLMRFMLLFWDIIKEQSVSHGSWFKILMSLLLLQVFVSIILLISFSININSFDVSSKLIYIGSVYALIKANTFVRDFMGGLSTDISLGISNINSFIKGG